MSDTRNPPAFTLEEAAQAIAEQLAANKAAKVDRVGGLMLNAYDERLRGWLSLARSTRTPGWFFNENWNGPALADVIGSCRTAAIRAEDQQRRAACRPPHS
jgi:hypothetical protein